MQPFLFDIFLYDFVIIVRVDEQLALNSLFASKKTRQM